MRAFVGFAQVATLGASLLAAASASSADLKVGDKAPDFSLPGTDGRSHELTALAGKTVVLAWFPKAFTSG